MNTKSKHAKRNLSIELEMEASGWSGNIPDTLLTDGQGQWFLAGGCQRKPQPVSVAAALAWYSRCLPFSQGARGDLSRLTADAANLLANF